MDALKEDFSKYNGEGTQLRKAQLRMLDILIEVDKICKKHNITYWIDYGTLLGAVRHGGFIPWDDDLDICMMEEDYDRFIVLAPKELSEQFVMQNLKTEKYFPLSFTKIVDKNSKTVDVTNPYSHSKRKYQGLWIDVFPIIKGDIRLRRWIEPIYGRCFRRVHHYEPFGISVAVSFLLYPVIWLLKQFMVFLCNLCNDDKRMNDFSITICQIQKHKSDYLPTKEIKFENVIVPIPNHAEKVLTDYYGDYMKIPPEEKRETHAIKIDYFE